MKEAAAHALVIAAALALIAGSIFGLGDRETLVSPPEAIAEDFMRALATGRYDVAMRYVDPHSGISREEVRAWSDALRAGAGSIQNVDVPFASHDGRTAVARYTVITTSRREIDGDLQLRFDRSWQITR